VSLSSDDDTDYTAMRLSMPSCAARVDSDDCHSQSPTVLGIPSLKSEGSDYMLLEAPTSLDATPDVMEVDADLQRGLQWLTNGESPKAMEIPAGASAEDIEREEEAEKARLRVWLSSMCEALDLKV